MPLVVSPTHGTALQRRERASPADPNIQADFCRSSGGSSPVLNPCLELFVQVKLGEEAQPRKCEKSGLCHLPPRARALRAYRGQRRWSVREPQGQERPLSPPHTPKAQSKGVPGTCGLGAHIRLPAQWPEGAEEPSPASRRAAFAGGRGQYPGHRPLCRCLLPAQGIPRRAKLFSN